MAFSCVEMYVLYNIPYTIGMLQSKETVLIPLSENIESPDQSTNKWQSDCRAMCLSCDPQWPVFYMHHLTGPWFPINVHGVMKVAWSWKNDQSSYRLMTRRVFSCNSETVWGSWPANLQKKKKLYTTFVLIYEYIAKWVVRICLHNTGAGFMFHKGSLCFCFFHRLQGEIQRHLCV